MKEIYERYMNKRDELGLTDYKVAKMSGVRTCTLSEWKKHYRTNGASGYQPKIEKLKLIADVIQVEVSELIS